jgi:cell division protein FtsB
MSENLHQQIARLEAEVAALKKKVEIIDEGARITYPVACLDELVQFADGSMTIIITPPLQEAA